MRLQPMVGSYLQRELYTAVIPVDKVVALHHFPPDLMSSATPPLTFCKPLRHTSSAPSFSPRPRYPVHRQQEFALLQHSLGGGMGDRMIHWGRGLHGINELVPIAALCWHWRCREWAFFPQLNPQKVQTALTRLLAAFAVSGQCYRPKSSINNAYLTCCTTCWRRLRLIYAKHWHWCVSFTKSFTKARKSRIQACIWKPGFKRWDTILSSWGITSGNWRRMSRVLKVELQAWRQGLLDTAPSLDWLRPCGQMLPAPYEDHQIRQGKWKLAWEGCTSPQEMPPRQQLQLPFQWSFYIGLSPLWRCLHGGSLGVYLPRFWVYSQLSSCCSIPRLLNRDDGLNAYIEKLESYVENVQERQEEIRTHASKEHRDRNEEQILVVEKYVFRLSFLLINWQWFVTVCKELQSWRCVFLGNLSMSLFCFLDTTFEKR